MRIAVLCAIIAMISFSCFSPKAILSKQGNTYLYTKIKDKRICFDRPHIKSLTTFKPGNGKCTFTLSKKVSRVWISWIRY